MISQIGKKKQSDPAGFAPLEMQKRLLKRTKSPTGFTLIELMIVATIIVVLVAISSPLFRATFRDIELEDTAYNIGKLITYGQQKAIIEEKKYRLIFDTEKGSYHLLAEDLKGEESRVSADAEEAESTSHAGDAVTQSQRWERVIGRFGRYFYLPEGIEFKSEADKITFLPGGRCDKISLYIINQKNKTYKIETNGRAGYVKISEGEE